MINTCLPQQSEIGDLRIMELQRLSEPKFAILARGACKRAVSSDRYA